MELLNQAIRFVRQKNEGFDAKAEQKLIDADGDHYSSLVGELGAKFGKETVLKADRNWKPEAERLAFEAQRKRIESMFCTVFGTENMIQLIQLAKYGEYEEYDEIPLANLANVSPYRGGSPHKVAEAIRKYGMFPAGTYPFTREMKKKTDLIMTPTPAMMAEAAKWKDRWDFGHEWLFPSPVNTIQDIMYHQLQFSPLGVGVAAWYQKNGIYYKPNWANDNHWTGGIAVGAEYGQYWWILDSYKDSSGTPFKKVAWDYPFAFVKKYKLRAKDDKYSAGQIVYNNFQGKRIQRYEANGEMYFVSDELIKYLGWWTNDEWVQGRVNIGLNDATKEGELKGITEDKFKQLKDYATLQGIKVQGFDDVKGSDKFKH